MVLVDTSVWIEIFGRPRRSYGEPGRRPQGEGRKPTGLDPAALFDLDEVVTCLPVIQEVLQGFRDEKPFQIAREAILSFPVVESPMSDGLFLEAVSLYRSARRQGLTIRSSVDCLIAACALRHDLEVLHHDRDFAALSRVSALRHRRV